MINRILNSKKYNSNCAKTIFQSEIMNGNILRDLHRLLAIFMVTKTLIGEVIDCERRLVTCYSDLSSTLVGDYLLSLGMNQETVELVRGSLPPVPEIFHRLNVNRLEKLIEEESPVYVKPRTYELDVINCLARKKVGKRTRKIKRASFQYFSIRDTILAVLRKKENFDKVLHEHQSEAGVLRTDIDGSVLRGQSGILPQFENPLDPLSPVTITMRILLYTDEFEVVNPLGAKTSKHKINGFYYKLLNIQGSGKLKHIFVYGLAKAVDVKTYGYNVILEPFVQEMEELIVDGIDCTLHGRSVTLRANFVGVTGDTLGLHDILHLMSPSTVSFCRDCLITRDEFRRHPWLLGQYRSEQHRRSLVRRCQRSNSYWLIKKHGYKVKDTILKKLRLSPRCNRKWDLMHDLFEGTSMLVIKVLLNYCIRKGIFTIDFFNERVKSFDYGSMNESEKPSPNFTEESLRNMKTFRLKQNACQVHLLLRALPFLIRDKLKAYYDATNEWEQYEIGQLTKLLSLHLEIVKLICSREITIGQADHLERCVRQHNRLYHELKLENPTYPMLNKIHHLLHYCHMIKEWGPAPLFETSRFEGLHKKLKQRMRSSSNYKNATKTIADRIAINFSYEYSYDNAEPEVDLMSSVFDVATQRYTGAAMKFHGVAYKKGQVICLKLDDSDDRADIKPVFGIIESIHYKDGVFSFTVNELITDFFDDEFCAYQVTQKKAQSTWLWSEMEYKDPMTLWRNCVENTDDENTFVSVKTANI